MKLYLYDTDSKQTLLELDHVISYTDQKVVTEEGVYSPLAENVELSGISDCSQMLRADWKRDNPSEETRIEELETLMATLLFGGETI